MGRLIVSEFVSLDGVMKRPGGDSDYAHAGWVLQFPDPEQGKYKLDEVMAHEALLVGRRTYETFAAAWPSRTGVFADRMNTMPKYVASTTLQRAEWSHTTVLSGDVSQAGSRLKQEVGGDLLIVGSRTLVHSLGWHGLIDEYRLLVFPIVLGSGMRLFGGSVEAMSLVLTGSRRLQSGTMILTYHPANTPDRG